MAAGGLFVLALHLATVTWGLSQPACEAILLAAGLGLLVARQTFGDWSKNDSASIGMVSAIAVLSLGLPSIVDISDSLTGAMGVGVFETRWLATEWLLVLMLPCVTLPMMLIGWQMFEREQSAGRLALPAFVLQFLAGIAMTVFLLGPSIGIHLAVIVLALLAVSTTIASWFWRTEEQVTQTQWASHIEWPVWCRVPTAMTVGIMTACGVRMIAQLMVTAEWVFFVELSALFFGYGVGWIFSRAAFSARYTKVEKALIATTVFSLLIAAAFPNLVDLSLRTNAQISSEALLVLIRSMMITGLLAPFGVLFALANSGFQSEETQRQSLLLWTTAGVGFLITRGILFSFLGVNGTVLVAVGFVLVPAVFLIIQHRMQLVAFWSKSHIAKVAVVASLTVILTGPLLVQRYQPGMATRLLFSTNVFNGFRAGYSQAELLAVDDGRIAAVVEGEFGTITDQRQRAVQSQLRLNGTPKSISSLDSRLCPQFSGEVLQAVVPLVLHDSPRDILVLGLRGGVPTKTALDFPIESLTTVEPDRALAKLIHHRADGPNSHNSWWHDSRHTVINADISLAAKSLKKQYDIVISNNDDDVQHHVASTTTREYFRNTAQLLKPNGLFCYRLRISDFGESPLKMAASTLQSVFSQVIAFDTAPGELLFVCSRENQPIGNGWRLRVEAPHAKQVFSQIGWDWTVITNTAFFTHEQLAKIANGNINNAANGYAALNLPKETMRWGAKWQEVSKLLANKSTRLLNQLDDQELIDEALARVSDVTMLRKIVINHPDEPWVYRKVVKDRLIDEPRSAILPVKGEGLKRMRHPDDERRLEYFKALGGSLRSQSPSTEEIQRVADFEQPYDPLVSYFIHNELARLHKRAGESNAQQELMHRLHAIFFGSMTDRSVRDIHRAIELVTDEKHVVLTDTERWDYLNSLVEVLKLRWETRGRVQALEDGIILNDIQQSSVAIEQALETMRKVAPTAGIAPRECQARENVIKRLLTKPLKTYQARLAKPRRPMKRKTAG